MKRETLPQTSHISVEFGNPKMRLFCKHFIHTPHEQKFHSRFSFGSTNHTLFLLQDLPLAYMLHSRQDACLHSRNHASSCNHCIGSLAQLKNASAKKSRRVRRTQATSCPKTRDNLGQIFSVVDDLQEQLHQATPPHQAPALQSLQSTNCQPSPTHQHQFWWRKQQCWKWRRHLK